MKWGGKRLEIDSSTKESYLVCELLLASSDEFDHSTNNLLCRLHEICMSRVTCVVGGGEIERCQMQARKELKVVQRSGR